MLTDNNPFGGRVHFPKGLCILLKLDYFGALCSSSRRPRVILYALFVCGSLLFVSSQ